MAAFTIICEKISCTLNVTLIFAFSNVGDNVGADHAVRRTGKREKKKRRTNMGSTVCRGSIECENREFIGIQNKYSNDEW